MTPILVRPVREQLEHDRVIRLLQQRWRRKYAVGINQGSETAASVAAGRDRSCTRTSSWRRSASPTSPRSSSRSRPASRSTTSRRWPSGCGWAQLKAEFHLYVPTGSVDPARRLCSEHNIPVAEIWTYPPDRRPDAVQHGLQGARRRPRAARRAAAEAPAKPAARKAHAQPHQRAANGRRPEDRASPPACQARRRPKRAVRRRRRRPSPPASRSASSLPGRAGRSVPSRPSRV